MKPSLLCHIRDCVRPASSACECCEKKLCATHYGPGSSSKCNACFHRPAIEEARREAASQAASW